MYTQRKREIESFAEFSCSDVSFVDDCDLHDNIVRAKSERRESDEGENDRLNGEPL